MTDAIRRSGGSGSYTTVVNVLAREVAAAFTEGLLDAYPSAAFAYSFRKLRVAYAGSAVRIRRSSDNAEADIGFVGQNFDTAAAASHIGGGSGFIVTWYDQSGNARDLTQATVSSQPDYTASGIGGLPSALFNGGNSLDKSEAIPVITNSTFFGVMTQSAADDENTLMHWGVNNTDYWLTHATYANLIYFDHGNSTTGRMSVAQPPGWDNNEHILELYRDSGDNQAIVVDGVELANVSKTVDTVANAATLNMGTLGGGAPTHTGYISESVFWTTDLGSTNRTGARTNINSYYSVF